MGYDYHIGVDHQKAYGHIVAQDKGGKTLRSGRVRNDSCAVANFLLPYSGNAHAVMEATRNWTLHSFAIGRLSPAELSGGAS